MGKIIAFLFVFFFSVTSGLFAVCPAVTAKKSFGIKSTFPQQFELKEFEKSAKCSLSFQGNPDAAKLNSQIQGNPKKLPAVKNRLPQEPLVVAPYEAIGSYGGVLKGLSKATESGTSGLLSVRHVNLVRYSDNLKDIVPNVAKSWKWNKDFTQITFQLRKGHKWSDGQPFTAEDIVFWYNNILMDPKIVKKPGDRFLINGKKWKVEATNPVTLKITLPEPKPGLLAQFATDYAQPFQPKHFLKKFHPKFNPKADQEAKKLGFANGYEALLGYYSGSDWKDVPSPLLKFPNRVSKFPKAVVPTLESHIVVAETSERRKLVANPYFHMVDTQGNQLPYINEISEVYVGDEEVQTLKLINGEVSYKQQAVNLDKAPVLLQNQKKGNYKIDMVPTVGKNVIVSFNLTANNKEKRDIFNNLKFRQAMSIAIDRAEIIDSVYFGQGEPEQYTLWDPRTVDFIDKSMLKSYTQFDSKRAKKMLDEIGVVDKDGDGFRDLPGGKRFVLNIQFATQGTPSGVPEILAANWTAIGIKTTSKEVTSDEYRAAQSANELEVHIWWDKVKPGAVVSYNPGYVIPPFDTYFDLRNGILWAKWMETKGKEGIKPPEDVFKMIDLMSKFQAKKTGSKEQNRIGKQIAQIMVNNLWFIGTTGGQKAPVYHSNALGNFKTMTVKSYDYYQMYPYRPNQYYIKK